MVDWGTAPRRTVLSGVEGNTAAFSHTYGTSGSFPVAVTVDDGEGGTDTGGFLATVTAFCGGLPVTIDAGALGLVSPISGTGGRDVILGTPRPDVINALGGNDVVCGGQG